MWWHNVCSSGLEKREEIRLSPMKQAPGPTESILKSKVNTERQQNVDYTTIADRLKTDSWSNNSHPTGVVKPIYGIPTFPLTAKAV